MTITDINLQKRLEISTYKFHESVVLNFPMFTLLLLLLQETKEKNSEIHLPRL